MEIGPDDAYGDYRDDLVFKVKREELGPEIIPIEGMVLRMRTASGRFIPVKVAAVTETDVTIDANHPLAGQVLYFDLELVKIAD